MMRTRPGAALISDAAVGFRASVTARLLTLRKALDGRCTGVAHSGIRGVCVRNSCLKDNFVVVASQNSALPLYSLLEKIVINVQLV